MDYYCYDYRKLSFAECFTATRGFGSIVLLFCKLFRIRLHLRGVFRYARPVGSCLVELGQLPSYAGETIDRAREKLGELGFISPQYFSMADPVSVIALCGCVMRHESGNAAAVALVARAASTQPPTVRDFTTVVSITKDNRILETTNQGAHFRSPPHVEARYIGGAAIERLWRVHEKRLAEPGSESLPVATSADAMDMFDRMERESFDMGVARGVYRRVTEEELSAERKRLGIVYADAAVSDAEFESSDAEGGLMDQPVVQVDEEEQGNDETQDQQLLHEIERVLNHTTGAGSKAMLFVISAILFLGAGSALWSWETTVSLIPILLIHELGHYVAMRRLKYRNLRMLFLPMLGAAVMGRNFNVSGWKKVVVALAGPVPGIFLAILFGVIGINTRTEWMVNTALLAFVLNGINLLPFLPMDGGHIVHTTLFSRHGFLDLVFRLIATAAFIVGAILFGDFVFWFLAAVMVSATPAVIRTGRIVSRLSKVGLQSGGEDDNTIPAQAALAIANEIRATTPRPLPVRLVAERTLEIYERVTAQPPSGWQTAGLLAIHGVSFVVAIVGLFVLVVYRHGG